MKSKGSPREYLGEIPHAAELCCVRDDGLLGEDVRRVIDGWVRYVHELDWLRKDDLPSILSKAFRANDPTKTI